MQSRIVEVLKAGSIIERDGVRHLLESNDIACMTEHRDMIVVLGHEPTLSLEGYSSFFDGYKIFVKSEDQARARQLIKENFQSQPEDSTPDYARKFLISCMFSMTMLPVIGHLAALYHLKKAFEHKQKISAVYLVTGLFLWSLLPIIFLLGGGLDKMGALKMFLGF